MAYQELIKNFDKIRRYIRDFYVYGFRSRMEYDTKSPRSYDNERRRIESWLGDYMSFHQDAAGKRMFLSLDSRHIPHNPLYRAFQARSFTDRDITFHFFILDILADGKPRTFAQILETLQDTQTEGSRNLFLDDSTLRKKLKEYVSLGLLAAQKQGHTVSYRRTDSDSPDLTRWEDAISFFSEASPLGVVGSFLLNRLPEAPDLFRFKHHYILHTLDSDILAQLLDAIREHREVTLTLESPKTHALSHSPLVPLRVYSSTQTGRQYVLGYPEKRLNPIFVRVDAISSLTAGDPVPDWEELNRRGREAEQHLWGVTIRPGRPLERVEMKVHVEPWEDFIVRRLEREKRHGRVTRLDANTWLFQAEVEDAKEMLPWLRTFLGRIESLSCSNAYVQNTFQADLDQLNRMYGLTGEEDPNALP